MTPQTAKLKAAFQDGIDAARDSGRGFSSRLRWPAGKQRDFFETAYFAEEKKMEAEYQAWIKTPEYKEQVRKQNEMYASLANGLKALNRNDYTSARKHLNTIIGL